MNSDKVGSAFLDLKQSSDSEVNEETLHTRVRKSFTMAEVNYDLVPEGVYDSVPEVNIRSPEMAD